MTLMLASMHPELWRGAVDMFGLYDLFTFMGPDARDVEAVLLLAVGDPSATVTSS